MPCIITLLVTRVLTKVSPLAWHSTTLSASWLLPSSVTTAHLLLLPRPSLRTSPPTTRTPKLAKPSALKCRVYIAFWQWNGSDRWKCSG